MLPHPAMMLIDLDGTLVDSVPDLAAAADAMQRELGLPGRGEEKVRQWVGNGVEKLVKRTLINNLEGEPEEALFNQAYPIFKKHYTACNGQHSRLYPGVEEGLAWLEKQGFPFGCITNKAKEFTEPLLTKLGIIERFHIILSGDTLPEAKPHPMPLKHATQYFGVPEERAIMVGDSVTDVRAARNAEFGAVVCVTYGYNHGQDIRDASPDAVIDSLSQLADLWPDNV
jgi:phosphoglycolate phosphatase